MKMTVMIVQSIPRWSMDIYLKKQEKPDFFFPCNLPLDIFQPKKKEKKNNIKV